MLVFCIMAGGVGERFWPLSTPKKPKQLLSFFSDESLIRLTYNRLLPLTNKKHIFISTNQEQELAIKKEIPELPKENLIIEPERRDTAAAIGYATIIISKRFKNSIIGMVPSDHFIRDVKEFQKVVLIASEDAKQRKLVLVGMTPTRPETGYGYIETFSCKTNVPTQVASFKEKPDFETAQRYLSEKKFLWNAGMLFFTPHTLLESFKKNDQSTYILLKKMLKTPDANKNTVLFRKIKKTSFDYDVLEKSDNVDVVPAVFDWDDVGNYNAFDILCEKKPNGDVEKNVTVISLDSSNNIVVADGKHQRISLIGIKDSIIAVTSKEILIAKKDSIQSIKELVQKANAKNY